MFSNNTFLTHRHIYDAAPGNADRLAINEVIDAYNGATLANGGKPNDAVDLIPLANGDNDLISPITFKCEYIDQNRFVIRRTDPGRLFETGEFFIAIQHYQIAKAFGAPWNSTGIQIQNGAPFLDSDIPEDSTFYLPRHETNWTGLPNDDTGTWNGQSRGKTFREPHTHFILRSSRWKTTTRKRVGANVYISPYNDTDDVGVDHPDPKFESVTHDGYNEDWYSQAMVMPFSSRIRGDDCYYIRSSLYGSDTIQTNNGSSGSDLLQMVSIKRTLGEVEFWNPTYTPEPHIISRRDIPSLRFTIHDKDNHLVDFNGEEILLEIEFITFDVVTIPIPHPAAGERYVAPHNFAPDYTSRVMPQQITTSSHLPPGFQNFRM